MASKDDMSIPSKSNDSLDPFEPVRNSKPNRGSPFFSLSNLFKKPESQSADETKFMTFVETFGSPLSCHAVRLQPGQELRKELLKLVEKSNLKAPFIMSCVGSARNAKLRMANASAEDPHYVSYYFLLCLTF